MHASLLWLHPFGMVANAQLSRASKGIYNSVSRLIRQYFTRQLAQVSLFANILPLQNFPTYGIQY